MAIVQRAAPTFTVRRQRAGRRTGLATRIKALFVAASFALYQGAFLPLISGVYGADLANPGESEAAAVIGQALVFLGLIVFLAPYWYRLPRLIPKLGPVLLIVALCLTSSLWSDLPATSARRGIALLICMALGIFSILEFGLRQTLDIILKLSIVTALSSIAVFIFIPSIGHETALGYSAAMRGVFSQKNVLAAAMLTAFIISQMNILGKRSPRLKDYAPAALFLLCIALARSSSCLLIATATIPVAILLYPKTNWRIRTLTLFASLAALSIVGFVVVFMPDFLFEALGRDPSLTGRVPLWQMVIAAIRVRPWLGYGYCGIWSDQSTLALYIWSSIHWIAPSAHNAYLDVVLQLGVGGLLLVLWWWARILVLSRRARRGPDVIEVTCGLVLLVAVMMLGFIDGRFPYPDQFSVLLTMVLLHLELRPVRVLVAVREPDRRLLMAGGIER